MYLDTHRKILQYLMTAGSATIEEVLNVYLSCFDEDVPEGDNLTNLNEVITKINEVITPFHQEIRTGICEITGNKYFIFINTISNELSRMQKEFKEKDLEYLKLLIEAIMHNPEKRLPEHVYLNIANRVHGNYSQNVAIDFIQDLIWKTYFIELDDCISFGLRFIYECEPYLREEFPDILNECTLCKEFLFNGDKCMSCQVTFHKHCLKKYISKRKKCPNCQTYINNNAENEQPDKIQRTE
ncbi:non-structural maintenance of chromosomes element 1 homolog [Chrysoperla carnea]|uniref:non-structural maintenance of chromosomes element 1 homolog n=1 Tax=Chrysoperla carnea TaxID=189513 RepID=UPI001D071614|nr:non-structural maintenance of chromosomes element 1 homolog [Chrysoperla carnea]